MMAARRSALNGNSIPISCAARQDGAFKALAMSKARPARTRSYEELAAHFSIFVSSLLPAAWEFEHIHTTAAQKHLNRTWRQIVRSQNRLRRLPAAPRSIREAWFFVRTDPWELVWRQDRANA